MEVSDFVTWALQAGWNVTLESPTHVEGDRDDGARRTWDRHADGTWRITEHKNPPKRKKADA